MVIEKYANKALNQFGFKIYHSGNGSGSGGGLSVKSNMTCHKCGKNGCIQKYCRSNENFSSGKPTKK